MAEVKIVYALGYTSKDDFREGISPQNCGGISTIEELVKLVVEEEDGLFLEYFKEVDSEMIMLSEEEVLVELGGDPSSFEQAKANVEKSETIEEYLDWWNNR